MVRLITADLPNITIPRLGALFGAGTGRELARNTLFNGTGQIAPSVAALLSLGYLAHRLAPERLGVLSLSWTVLAYTTFFDFGLTRTTTRFAAVALSNGDDERLPAIIWPTMAAQLTLGVLLSVALYVGAPVLVDGVFKVAAEVRTEAQHALRVLSLAIPIVLCSGSLRGVLESARRFGIVSVIKVVSNSLLFLGPAVAIGLGYDLGVAGGVLALAAALGLVAYLVVILLLYPTLRRVWPLDLAHLRELVAYSGWVALSTSLVPLLVFSDRLLIASLVSVAAVAYYSAPYDMVSRLLIIPTSLGAALFPSFSTSARRPGPEVIALYWRGVRSVMVIMGPIVVALAVLAHPLLRLWLGEDFAEQGTVVVQLVAVGMLLNAVSQMAANLLDGAGRPDLRAWVLLSYLFVYLALAWVLISQFGIAGAALAWAVRGGLECVLFMGVAARYLGASPSDELRAAWRWWAGRTLAQKVGPKEGRG